MPKCRVEILTPALDDIERIADYYLMMVGPKSAERITDKLLDDEYVCVYKIIDMTVYIYRVVHGATDYPKLLK